MKIRKASSMLMVATVATLISLAARPAAAQPATKQSRFDVKVKMGTDLYIPAEVKVKPTDNVDPLYDSDLVTMTVTLLNMSGKPQNNVQVDCAMYKTDRQGAVKDIAHKTEKLSFRLGERKIVVLQGQLTAYTKKKPLTTPKRHTTTEKPEEEIYGWYAKIQANGQTVYEQSNPATLKDSKLVEKSFAQPKGK